MPNKKCCVWSASHCRCLFFCWLMLRRLMPNEFLLSTEQPLFKCIDKLALVDMILGWERWVKRNRSAFYTNSNSKYARRLKFAEETLSRPTHYDVAALNANATQHKCLNERIVLLISATAPFRIMGCVTYKHLRKAPRAQSSKKP